MVHGEKTESGKRRCFYGEAKGKEREKKKKNTRESLERIEKEEGEEGAEDEKKKKKRKNARRKKIWKDFFTFIEFWRESGTRKKMVLNDGQVKCVCEYE